MYELDPNYQPQFDPNMAQFMQQEQGQYMGGVSRGGMCTGGECTSWTPTTTPSLTPTWRSSSRGGEQGQYHTNMSGVCWGGG